ncbi:MAG: DNA methyltransferase [Gemmatimonadaceae bacterium]
MRLSWNEIRVRAAEFAKNWAGHGYEKGQTQLFYRDFFDVFGMPVRRVAAFEEPVKRLGEKQGFIDLFWKGVLLVEQKSKGRNLESARTQALDYFPGLKAAEHPRFLLVSDFQTFDLTDLETDERTSIALAELPKHVEKFGFIIGVERRSFEDQDPVNVKAAEMMGRLHDALEASAFTGHDLELFLVRLVFCLFADDTGIFEPRDIFLDYLTNRTGEDGTDLGAKLVKLFQVLNTEEDARGNALDEDLARFPYVNGDLFKEGLQIPDFDAKGRQLLLDACEFDWGAISPAIFGSLFQSVMDAKERRAQGAHYTTEQNILKVLGPLCLDDLKTEFARIRDAKTDRQKRLQAFQRKLRSLTFFDPACGCGNFLIIAYRELRSLEIAVIRELRSEVSPGQLEADTSVLSLVDVDQFYGIELGAFPARIAETAMWMMDHIMNNRLSLEFGQSYVRIPLKKSPHIVPGDALELAWASVLPPDQCTYVLGNPPFIGSKFQTAAQRAQVQRVAALGGSGGSLDYVTAWFITAGRYIGTRPIRIGFVATNSITQGEQVAQLWPILFDQCKLEIAFAHRTFAWGSDARGKAHVHVVILGLTRREHAPAGKRLFSYEAVDGEAYESTHPVLSPYLFDASRLKNPQVVVVEVSRPVNGMPRPSIGSQPIDDGQFIFTAAERDAFINTEPQAAAYLRPLVGAEEFLQGTERFILHLAEVSPSKLAAMPHVKARIAAVRKFRLASRRESTLRAAETPAQFGLSVIPLAPFLVVPRVSSERREYVPIGWLAPPWIPTDAVHILLNASAGEFALLTSAMHMSWLRHIGGRLKSDFRYAIGLVYNTFPLPPGGTSALKSIEPLAQAILDTRAAHRDATLADLYDPDAMPAALRKAHHALDRAVEKLYRKEPFKTDRERAEHLLGLYEQMVSPLGISGAGARKIARHR